MARDSNFKNCFNAAIKKIRIKLGLQEDEVRNKIIDWLQVDIRSISPVLSLEVKPYPVTGICPKCSEEKDIIQFQISVFLDASGKKMESKWTIDFCRECLEIALDHNKDKAPSTPQVAPIRAPTAPRVPYKTIAG